MNQQYLLFDERVLELVRDAEGGIRYHPGCVPPETAAQWMAALLACIPWRSLRRPMYERVVDVPRLIANVALRDPARPPCLDEALAAVTVVAPAPYTHVGLNLYRDGRDSVAPHGDREPELVAGQPIAIVSLGAPRDMLIRPVGGGASQRIALMPGSVLVMSHASQHTHEHGIPKCAGPVGPRISLAFRVRPARRAWPGCALRSPPPPPAAAPSGSGACHPAW